MEIRNTWALRGPNLWASFPVLEVELNLAGPPADASSQSPGFIDRLTEWLPSLIEHRCSVGERGGFIQRMREGTDLAHVLEHLTLELQSLAGTPVSFGRTRKTSVPGSHQVVVEFEEEEVARACLAAARELCLAAVGGHPFDIQGRLQDLRELANDVKLGPSTGAIVRAAKARGIPIRRLNTGSLVQLGQGSKSRRILTAETDHTGAVAEAIAQDKQLTRTLLRSVGAPVPKGEPVATADEAWEVAQDLGLPVVVKPQYGNHGRGVATNLTTQEQVRQAYAAAYEESPSILVETFAPGHDHRLLVIGDRLVAAALREPAHVVGDGRSTILELVAEVNKDPRRSDGHATSLSYIKLDAVGLAVLTEQGFSPDSVPPAKQMVLIRRNGNLSTGGTATDVTDRVHPDVAARAVDAARVIGLDIAGVDVVALDISHPLEEQQGAIVEVNAGPGLRMHLEPSAGKPRAVGEAIVSLLFRPGETGRIPTVVVAGESGRAAAALLVASMLRATGKMVGLSCSEGVLVGKRRIPPRDSAGLSNARSLLINPTVEAAVFDAEPGGLRHEGLPLDRCDVGVVTDIGQPESFGASGIGTLDELVRIHRTVIEAVTKEGFGILNADDPLVAAMARNCPGAVVYFARGGDNPLIQPHRTHGGRVVFQRGKSIVLAHGTHEESLTLPMHADPTEAALAAAAAAWCLGVGPASIVF